MKMSLNTLLVLVAFFLTMPVIGYAGLPERYAVEREVTASVTKDMATPYIGNPSIAGRRCVDGKPGSQERELIEFWGSMDCQYCSIREVVKAQKAHPDWCIVVRHLPSGQDALGKALAYEALAKFSSASAIIFWDDVVPTSDLPVSRPYQGSLIRAFSDANIQHEAFVSAMEKDAVQNLNQDIEAGTGVIPSTPTFVLEGIRFSSCDFTVKQLEEALDLAKKARSGDEKALQEIIRVITRGHLNEPML